MGCCGSDRKSEVVNPEHKFAYVNLRDFKSRSCLDILAYVGIYLGTIISIACYAADIYTASILLALDRWPSQVERTKLIDSHIAKIIFCTCIFLSFVLLLIDWIIAVRIIRSDGVAEAYMNVIAVRFNCIWGGRGKEDTGWRRFLVFAKLTKSRGWVDYIALFTYFAFKGWIRIIFAEGPRVVINTLTFISITKADNIVKDDNTLGAFEKFFKNFGALYQQNHLLVVSLVTMAFTTIIWILAILRLLIAAILYICFLWHIMSGGTSLRRYCKTRIDTRMGAIVQRKHDKALAREKEARPILRQPTIPNIALSDPVVRSQVGSNPDAMSSTAKLTTNASPPSTVMYTPPLPSALVSREPTIPNIPASDFGGAPPPQQSRTPGPGQPQPPLTRSNTYGPSAALPDHYNDRNPLPPYDNKGNPESARTFDPRKRDEVPLPVDPYFQPQPQPSARDYQMQPLPPNSGGRTTFVVDRLARQQTAPAGSWENQPPMSQRPGWDSQQPPRSQTAAPRQDAGYRPPPRSYTAAPPEAGYGPAPPRSQTAAPQGPRYGPPARSRTVAPQEDVGEYGPPPRNRTAMPQGDVGGYGPPPRSYTDPSFGGPPSRSHATGPQEFGYGAPPPMPRSQTAAPRDPGNGGYKKNQYQPVRQPPQRSLTAGPPQRDEYPAPPPLQRTGTAPPQLRGGPYAAVPPPRAPAARIPEASGFDGPFPPVNLPPPTGRSATARPPQRTDYVYGPPPPFGGQMM